MHKVPSLSFFFPALNEEAHIEDLVRKAERLLPEIALAWEIIPVDDGSTDGTKAILQRLAAENPGHVRPVHHETNQGYGKALISGFQNARYDLVFFTDGDRQLDKGDLIAGFRMHRRDPLTRQLCGLLWGTLVNVLFGLNIRDVNCAFKLVKRSVIDRVKRPIWAIWAWPTAIWAS